MCERFNCKAMVFKPFLKIFFFPFSFLITIIPRDKHIVVDCAAICSKDHVWKSFDLLNCLNLYSKLKIFVMECLPLLVSFFLIWSIGGIHPGIYFIDNIILCWRTH